MGKAPAFPIVTEATKEERAMKRLAPLVLALTLILTACGTVTPPVESIDPSSLYDLITLPPQTPPATPTKESLSRELPEGFALPAEEFEPAAYYLAEPFGEQGSALLALSADGRFSCRYSSWRQNPENGRYERRFTEAEAEFDGASLTYFEPAETPRPESFRAVSPAEALSAWRDMPYNDEVSHPFPQWTGRAEWEKTPGVRLLYEMDDLAFYEYLGARVSYRTWDDKLWLSGFTTESADFPFSVRGLGIGSSLTEVLGGFPEMSDSRTENPEKYRLLYGGELGFVGNYSDHNDCTVSVSDSVTLTRFYFDEGDAVFKIEFWNSVD